MFKINLQLINQDITVLLVMSLIFFLGNRCYAQTEFPENAAGNRAKEITDLLNSGDENEIEKYVENNFAPPFKNAFPMEQHVGIFINFHNDNKEFNLYEVKSFSETQIVFTLWAPETNNLLSIELLIESKKTHKIELLGIRPADKISDKEKVQSHTKEVKITSKKELVEFVNGYIQKLVENDEFSGAVLIAKNGNPIYKKAFGLANKSYNVPNKLDTKFNLGSMNKMFTGVAIMQLLQEGKLNINDKVGAILPDYPNKKVREEVTIHQLLTHTSGMGLYWREYFESSKTTEIKTVSDYDGLFNQNPLLFEPGERFSYSNCGPIVLGLIIEKLSGLTYDEYIRKNITNPSGMENTDCYDISIPVENLAIGYTDGAAVGEDYKFRHNNLFMNPPKGGPAGGGYSTVEDLLKFDIALRSNLLMEKKYFDLMTSGKVERTETVKYSYLFQEEFVNEHRIIGHSGGEAGVNAHFSMYMDLGYTVIILSNYDPPVSEKIAKKIKMILTQ